MKTKRKKPSYTAEPAEEGWDFDGARALDRGQQKAAGIPEPAAVGKMKVVEAGTAGTHQHPHHARDHCRFASAGRGSGAALPNAGRQRASHGRQGGVKTLLGPRGLIAKKWGSYSRTAGGNAGVPSFGPRRRGGTTRCRDVVPLRNRRFDK